MLRPGGYGVIVEPGKRDVEFDTVTCCHCGCLIHVRAGTAATVYQVWDDLLQAYRDEPGAGCWHCQKPVCLRCAALGTCRPLERQLEEAEGRHGRGLLIAVP